MSEEEIFELLKKQEAESSREIKYYIYYDPISRVIIHFRNYIEASESLPYIELSENEIGIPLDKFNPSNYQIIIVDGKPKLEKLELADLSLTKIGDFIYEIPKILSEKRIMYEDHPFDLLIEQNNPLKEFKIKLSKPLREKYARQGPSNNSMSIYVTALNDPNILYKTLRFDLDSLVQHEYYTIAFETDSYFDGSEANIYALKYFDNYVHVDIR